MNMPIVFNINQKINETEEKIVFSGMCSREKEYLLYEIIENISKENKTSEEYYEEIHQTLLNMFWITPVKIKEIRLE